MVTATAGALGYALAERPLFAFVLGCVAGLGLAGHWWFVTRMDLVRGKMTAEDRHAIRRFRRLHIAGMLLNVLLLGTFCFGMTRVSL